MSKHGNQLVLTLWDKNNKRGPSFLIQQLLSVNGDKLALLIQDATKNYSHEFILPFIKGMIYYDGTYYPEWACIDLNNYKECDFLSHIINFEKEKASPA